MLTSLRLVNFKNFADETLKLGPFTVIVGANASGKSNIRDAFRFLHGIGRGYTLAEIIGGKIGASGQMEWEPIRGAPGEIARFEPRYPNSLHTFSTHVEMDLEAVRDHFEQVSASYSTKVEFAPSGPGGFSVAEENLMAGTSCLYNAIQTSRGLKLKTDLEDDALKSELDRLECDLHKPVLRQIDLQSIWLPSVIPSRLSRELRTVRFLELSPERMKEPSIPGASVLGDYGQNLPTVLESICADADRKQTLLSWFEELTPMDVADFEFPRDPSGRVHLQIVERNGRKVSANSASDGTLRFLGILATLLNEYAGGIYFFEEIDTGIHPNRLWLLLDLIERQTAKGNLQVITTTHNPALLAWMNDETFEHTSVVYRDEYWSDSVIRPIADLYHLRELRKSQGIEWLLTSGWLEDAMKASEGDADTDHLDDDDEDDWGMEEE